MANATLRNKNAVGNALIIMLRNELLSFGIIMNLVQMLELGIGNRLKRETSIEQQMQELTSAGFEVKPGRRTVFIKIGNRWWQPGTYKGPNVYAPTDAPLPYTGVCDLDFQRWVTIKGVKTPYTTFSFSERLARARPPWCVLSQAEQEEMTKQVYNYIYVGSGGRLARQHGYSLETAFDDKFSAVKSHTHGLWF